MTFLRLTFGSIIASLAILACSSSGSSSTTCCNVGMQVGFPSCVCGTAKGDAAMTYGEAGACFVVSTTGQTCTISCPGLSASCGAGTTAFGQSASSCM
jgi:hypothetical protein